MSSVSYLEEIVLGVLVGVIGRVSDVKGRAAGEHLVSEHSERPPVHGEAVLLTAQDLRCYIVWRTAECGCRIAGSNSLLELLLNVVTLWIKLGCVWSHCVHIAKIVEEF